MANTTLAPGKRLRSGSEKIDGLKLCLTAPVQGDLCHFFLPFTGEGESYRWDCTVSPDAPGLDLERADKLGAKDGSLLFLSTILSHQVLKILGTDAGDKKLTWRLTENGL